MTRDGEFILPLRPEAEQLVKKLASDGLNPRTISSVLQLSELTGAEPDEIVARYKQLEAEVKRVVYDT